MNQSQFKRALALANSGDAPSWFVDGRIALESFDGCGLPHAKRVLCTIPEVASWLLYQAMQLNGEWDQHELANCREIAKSLFDIHSDPITDAKILRDAQRAQAELDAEDARRNEAARLAQLQELEAREREIRLTIRRPLQL